MHPLKNLLHRDHHHTHHSSPSDLVHRIHDNLLHFHQNRTKVKDLNHRREKIKKLLIELHRLLYGDSDGTVPDPKFCSKTALEFFKDKRSVTNPFRLLINCFADFDWESQTLACQIVTNLIGHKFPSSSVFIASEFLTENMDLVDFLLNTTFDLVQSDSNVALLYGTMLREFVRSQTVTKHVLNSRNCVNKFLTCVTSPNYTFASHVADTLEFLLTRHKSCVAEFLNGNYETFFAEFNSKLLVSSNSLIKSKALTVLETMLTEESNRSVMARYVSDVDNLKLVMNALTESKSVQLKAFHVFKLFVLNSEKPQRIVDILRLNRTKLLKFLDELKPSRQLNEEQFNEEKSCIIREIVMLDPQSHCYQRCRNAFNPNPEPNRAQDFLVSYDSL